MQTKLTVVLAQWAAGEKINVTAMAADLGISRQSLYNYRARFESEGLAGLFPRSRRPRSCPWQTPAVVEDEIVRLRKQLAEAGWDNGAMSIRYAMLDAATIDPPSPATIHRVLRRRGLVTDQPAKRPRSADRRFEFPTSNACWQIDAFKWELADGTDVVVFQIEDDYSRDEMDSYAAPAETGEAAWACWMRAVNTHGIPAMLLSDNHAAYSGARRGWTADLERNLHAIGVHTITSTPRHPQTCGKDERIHQTLQKWLDARPRAATLSELQAQLDQWRSTYGQRRHQGIHGQRPADRWTSADKATPAGIGDANQPTTRITHPVATEGGKISVDRHIICLGSQYSHAHLTAVRTGDHVAIFCGRDLIRDLTLDRTHRYQPSGTKPGGKRRKRIQPTTTPRRRSATATPATDEEDVTVQRPQRSEDERP